MEAFGDIKVKARDASNITQSNHYTWLMKAFGYVKVKDYTVTPPLGVKYVTKNNYDNLISLIDLMYREHLLDSNWSKRSHI